MNKNKKVIPKETKVMFESLRLRLKGLRGSVLCD